MKVRDITGQKFGRLTALSFSHSHKGHAVWNVRCDCGRLSTAVGSDMRRGKMLACGCRRGLHVPTHGGSYTSEYVIWSAMKRRCLNPKAPNYKNYGGRGITICDRWVNSFEFFLADMGARPSKGHSIDRIDVDGNYEPANCKWSTQKEQQNNKRRHKNFPRTAAALEAAE